MNKVILTISLIALIFIAGCIGTYEPKTLNTSVNKDLTVYFFYGQECPHCHNIMPFMQGLIQKYPNVDFQVREVWHNQTNRDISAKMLTDLGQPNPGVPLVIVGKTALVGDKDIPEQLEGIITNKTG